MADGSDDTDICVVNSDGTDLKVLAGGKDGALYPHWSPDGKRIVFSSFITVDQAAVAVMDLDGSHFRKVTKPDSTNVDYFPTWSSDGRIYFYRLDAFGAASEYSVKPDGMRVASQDVTADRFEVLPVGGGGGAITLLDPATDYLGDIAAGVGGSPDQKALAIAGPYDNGGTRFFIVNADGTGLSAVPGIGGSTTPWAGHAAHAFSVCGARSPCRLPAASPSVRIGTTWLGNAPFARQAAGWSRQLCGISSGLLPGAGTTDRDGAANRLPVARLGGLRMLAVLVAALAWFWWAVFVVLWVMFIYFTFALAVSKGRSPFLWVILAIFFPLITIIVLLVLPDRSTR